MSAANGRAAVVHLDESCLGNGREGANPGGAAGLVELGDGAGVDRRDFWLHAPATTNNRMALSSAIAALELLDQEAGRTAVLVVSDSEYLVKGMREWVPGWMARGWKRKAGPIENLPLWQQLVRSAEKHAVQWTWVRGHVGHPKNEYANDLAVRAAREQTTSAGLVPTGYAEWLATKRKAGRYGGYDPDAAFRALEARLARGERVALAE